MNYVRPAVIALLALGVLAVTGGGAFDSPIHDLAVEPADLTVFGADAGDGAGSSLAASADLNGDGLGDLLLGARFADAAGNAKNQAGEAYVIFGSPALGGTIDFAATAPDLAILGADAGDELGLALAGGDFNSDGIDDLLSGARFADGADNTWFDAGEAYVIFGSPALGGAIDLAVDPPPLTVIGANPLDRLGFSLAAGDFNDDDIDDILLGAPGADVIGSGKVGTGQAYVLFGSPTMGGTIHLFSTAPDLTVLGAEGIDIDTGLGNAGELGRAVAVGDVDDDGIDDLLLAAPFTSSGGEVYVIFGSTTLGGTVDLATSSADVTILSAGLTGAGAGDVNGDDIDDILLGARVLFGASTLGGTIDLASTTPDLTILEVDADDYLGRSGTGDFNSDGVDDLLLAAPGADAAGNAKPGAGEAYVIFGPTLGGTVDLATTVPDLAVLGAEGGLFELFPGFFIEDGDGLGRSTVTGDINGDGIDDLALGVWEIDAGGNPKDVPGTTYVIFGSPDSDGDGLLDAADNCPAWPNPDQSLPPWSVPPGDDDCDGWSTADESAIGTDPLLACGANAWPPDTYEDQLVDSQDMVALLPGLFKSVGQPGYSARLDIFQPGTIIDSQDLVAFLPFLFKVCEPPP